jgi:hypothetical protein
LVFLSFSRLFCFSCHEHAAASTLNWSRPFIYYTMCTSFCRGIYATHKFTVLGHFTSVFFSLLYHHAYWKYSHWSPEYVHWLFLWYHFSAIAMMWLAVVFSEGPSS